MPWRCAPASASGVPTSSVPSTSSAAYRLARGNYRAGALDALELLDSQRSLVADRARLSAPRCASPSARSNCSGLSAAAGKPLQPLPTRKTDNEPGNQGTHRTHHWRNHASSHAPAPNLAAERPRRRHRARRPAGLVVGNGRFLEGTDDAYVRADWVAVSAQVSGYVAEVLVADDADVQAGDLLLRLDPRDFRQRLRAAEAREAAAQAALEASARSWRPSIGNCWSRRRRSAAPAPMAKRREPNGAAPRPTGDATGNWPTSMPPVASAWRTPTRRTSERGRRRGEQAPGRPPARRQGRTEEPATRGGGGARPAPGGAAGSRGGARNWRATPWTIPKSAPHSPAASASRKVRLRQYVTPGLPLLAVVPLEQAYVVANCKDPARTHPPRATGRAGGGHVRPPLAQPRRQRGAGLRRGIRAAAAGQRHRQLHQDRPALPGAYPPGRRRRRAGPAASGMSVIATVDTREPDGASADER